MTISKLQAIANRFTIQAARANMAGDLEKGRADGRLAWYFDARSRGHSKRNAALRVRVRERRGEL
jgi:hypothetical protein